MSDDGLHAGFHDVSRQQTDPTRYFRILDVQAAAPGVVAMRDRALRALAPAPGGRILDVGCGTGEVARSFAERVAPGGGVVALDASDAMIEEARRRTPDGLSIEFLNGDALALDFADDSFDGVHSERVLQHVDDPERAFAEFVRVTRAGGRVVVVDTDWDTAILDGIDVDVERRMAGALADAFTHGRIGRRLYGIARRAGLKDVEIGAESLIFTDWDEAAGIGPPIGVELSRAVEGGRITEPEAAAARAALERTAAEGTFFTSVTMFVVSGVK